MYWNITSRVILKTVFGEVLGIIFGEILRKILGRVLWRFHVGKLVGILGKNSSKKLTRNHQKLKPLNFWRNLWKNFWDNSWLWRYTWVIFWRKWFNNSWKIFLKDCLWRTWRSLRMDDRWMKKSKIKKNISAWRNLWNNN